MDYYQTKLNHGSKMFTSADKIRAIVKAISATVPDYLCANLHCLWRNKFAN